jgi:NhaP-type Na+/H+ or K+/H+ antiporter
MILELIVMLSLTINGLRPGYRRRAADSAAAAAGHPTVRVLATANPRLVSIRSRSFLGFVGVSAVTAIFDVATLVGAHAKPASEQHVVMRTTMACVITLIVIHGLSATPVTRKLLSPAASEPWGSNFLERVGGPALSRAGPRSALAGEPARGL